MPFFMEPSPCEHPEGFVSLPSQFEHFHGVRSVVVWQSYGLCDQGFPACFFIHCRGLMPGHDVCTIGQAVYSTAGHKG